MSNLTIDQILAECGASPEVFTDDTEKTASAQPSSTPSIEMDEVDSMVSLLKEASVETDIQVIAEPRTFNEKLAEAIILSEALQEISPPSKDVMFKQAALEAGYPEDEIDAFLEKKAFEVPWNKVKKSGKYILGGSALIGAGAGAGEYHGRKKGRTRGRREGFAVGRTIQNKIDTARFRRYLMAARGQGQA